MFAVDISTIVRASPDPHNMKGLGETLYVYVRYVSRYYCVLNLYFTRVWTETQQESYLEIKTSWMRYVLHSMLDQYLLTPWSRVLLEKLTGSAASQEIPRTLCNP